MNTATDQINRRQILRLQGNWPNRYARGGFTETAGVVRYRRAGYPAFWRVRGL